jgi:hypothetical protein
MSRHRGIQATAIFLSLILCTLSVVNEFTAKAQSYGISGGDGSLDTPYIITSAAGFTAIDANPGANYKLGCDIDLSDIPWLTICCDTNPFTGVLDGSHHVLKNFRPSTSAAHCGLFGVIGNGGIVENLGIESGKITGLSDKIGSFCEDNYGSIKNCFNNISIVSNNDFCCLGGIAAINFGSISNCFNSGSLKGKQYSTTGGIAAENEGELLNCYNIGLISKTDIMGGIVGTGRCDSCYFLAQSKLYETGGGDSFKTGETADAMKSRSTYSNWDFDDLWCISADVNSGYPFFIIPTGNANLSALVLSAGQLSPTFNADTFSYTAEVENSILSVTVTPTAEDLNAVVSVNGKTPDNAVTLSEGENTITVTVKAKDGTVKTYAVKITRDAAGNANLSALTLSAGELSPDFNADTFSYTAEVANSISSVIVTPTAEDLSAVVLVDSKTADNPVNLSEGENTVTVTVKAKDGTVKTYTVKITRDAVGNANLSALSLSAGELSPAFNADTFSYTAEVENSVSSVTVTPMAEDLNAVVLVDSKTADNPVNLSEGENTVTVTVKAKDGTVKTYTVKITRDAAGNANLSALTLSASELSPDFNAKTTLYFANVQNNISSISVIATAAEKTSVVSINGMEASNAVALNVGDNTVTINVRAKDGTEKTYTVLIKREYSRYVFVTAPGADGAYSAFAPDYAMFLNGNDSFSFLLGNVNVTMPSWQLQTALAAGGMKISQKPVSQSVLADMEQYSPTGTLLAGAFTVEISGGIKQLSSIANLTVSLNSDLSGILSCGDPKIYYYDDISHTFTEMDAVFDKNSGTAQFDTSHFSTFVVAVNNLSTVPFHYTLTADSKYTNIGGQAMFAVTASRDTGSATLRNGRLIVVTTLKSGNQLFTYLPLSGDVTSFRVSVEKDAVKSIVYLTSSSFDGYGIPTTYALVKSVTS